MDVLIYAIISVLVIVIGYLVYFFTSKSIEKDAKHLQEIKETLEKYGKLHEEGHSMFTKYTYQDETYSVMFLKLNPEYKLTFNSKTIWERKKGGSKLYLEQKVFASIPGKKIVIIYPHPGPFMYHYDENEIRFTKPKEKFWNMQVIPASLLEEALKEGL
ncbi:hypothetical protein [Acholeplasma hippikon]|uniref:Uncharacterized protein n=1 Tax=Acholeplasma hippikon TaxID=264636 RepID=A0A449BJH4_9MOLU|nr:hypothetical protein [Acholeplasma hippikon]VEU82543.1 Uncharacterised protein [Acholeplasma hippikon]